MSIQVASVITIIVFYLVFFAVGAFAGRQGKTEGSATALLLANRQIPLVMAILTMTATWVGGGYINGTAEAVYDSGRGLVWAQAPWGYALSLILGGVLFAARMRRRRFTTLLDLFEVRYGKRISATLFVPALLGEIFWSSAILAALGATLSTILGINYTVSILVSAVIAVSYTSFGGLWSVAYTDTLQVLCILGGLVVAIPYAVEHVGGFSAAVTGYLDTFGESASLMPPLKAWSGDGAWGFTGWLWTDMALLLVLGGIPWQVYFQRVLACRDERTAVRLSIFAGLGCLLMALPAVFIGVIGTSVDWQNTAAGAAPEAALILPYVLRYLTPPLVAAIGLGAIAAAVMSSVDSSFLSVAGMFSWNVYRPLFRPAAKDSEIRLVIRVAVVLTGLLSASLALSVRSVYTLWALCGDLVYVVLFPQLVMALYFKGANRWGAVAGLTVGLILRLGGGEPYLEIPAVIPYPLTGPDGITLFPFRTVAMVSSLGVIWLVSRLTQRRCPATGFE